MKRSLILTLTLMMLLSPTLSLAVETAIPTQPEPIRIGEISEVRFWSLYAQNQRRGWQMALEEINAAGGVLGRPIEVVMRNGGDGSPSDVLRDAEELFLRQNINIFYGTCPDNVSLAISDYAKRHGILFLKGVNGTNRQIWQDGHDLAFRFDVPNYMYGKAFAAAAAKLPIKRWAFVAPDFEFGRSVVAEFQKELKAQRPDVEFVMTQWHPTLKSDAGAIAGAINSVKPDGIFIASFGSDLVKLVRQGNARKLYDNRAVIGVLVGQPEGLNVLGKEAPVGWITAGYPMDQIDTPAHKAFLAKYRAKYNADPGWFSFVGYNAFMSLAKAIEKAGSTDPQAISAAMKGMTFDSLV